MQEPLRFFEWQRTQKKIVDKTEDRSIQADPERERQDGNDRESGRFAELTKSEFEIVHIILFSTPRLDQCAMRGVPVSTKPGTSR